MKLPNSDQAILGDKLERKRVKATVLQKRSHLINYPFSIDILCIS
jgi:hypothetical protein